MELKQCPFCGSDAKLMKEGNTHCNCSNKECLLYGDRYFHIDKWNKRLPSASVDKLVPLDEKVMEAVIWQFFNPQSGTVRKIKDWAELSKYICQRFRGPHGIFIGDGGLEEHLKSENQAFMHLGTENMKVKEPQWPKKVYTKKSFPSREDYRNGFNEATAACKQAWKDAQGKQ
jgi:hypothetical protein